MTKSLINWGDWDDYISKVEENIRLHYMALRENKHLLKWAKRNIKHAPLLSNKRPQGQSGQMDKRRDAKVLPDEGSAKGNGDVHKGKT